MTLKEQYAQNYWQLANLITGFAVAEVLATLFAIGANPAFAKGISDWRPTVVWLTAIAHLLYAGAVCFCHRQEANLILANEPEIRKGSAVVCGGRAIAVLLAGVLLIVVALATQS